MAEGEYKDKELLLFQLGPVQEFIAQARSTRDLWSGSYLLSWLVAHAIIAAWKAAGGNVGFDDMVMPSLKREDNPLMFALLDQKNSVEADEIAKALIPNLPNRFSMIVPAGTGKTRAEAADKAVRDELESIGASVWKWLEGHGVRSEWKDRFDEQIKAFPQITWAVLPMAASDSFANAWNMVNDVLAARRNTRNFAQWNPVSKDAAVKDSLSGKEECIGDEAFWKSLKDDKLFSKATGHRYGAMNLIKRIWCQVEDAETGKNYLASNLVFRERSIAEVLRVPDLPSIAKRNTDPAVPYVAVLAFDGDHMGVLVDKQKENGKEGIRGVSASLSKFALGNVPNIIKEHDGHLIYAGGDDVLAVLPSSKAVACAEKIRDAFHAVGNFGLDGSCGIAVGHFKAPLQMLVKSAQRMEGVAKNKYGRGALTIAVYKRSGEILEWGTKWGSPSLSLMKKVTELSAGDKPKLSGRFPYALAALLQPYELSRMTKDAKTDVPQNGAGNDVPQKDVFTDFREVIMSEVEHVLSRQGEKLEKEEYKELKGLIGEHFDTVAAGEPDQTSHIVGRELTEEEKKGKKKIHPEDFLNLFLVETFLNRKREGR